VVGILSKIGLALRHIAAIESHQLGPIYKVIRSAEARNELGGEPVLNGAALLGKIIVVLFGLIANRLDNVQV